MQVFLAGATGVVGRALTPMLRAAGHGVIGMTRSREGARRLADLGVTPVVVDAFDAEGVREAVRDAAPDVVVHQLTDLSGSLDPAERDAMIERNARLRREGTANLVAAAKAAAVARVVAQSIAWAYKPGALPHSETDPLDTQAEGARGITVNGGVVPLEDAVLRQDSFEAVVLRYGQLYGPGTWTPVPQGGAPVHVEAAAHAACLALSRGAGAYNIAEPGGDVRIDKAVAELGWNAGFRSVV